MTMDPALLPATALVDAFRRRTLSPVEATQAALDRITARNETVNAFRLVDAEGALAAARLSEQRWRRGEPIGLLDGVPSTIKDQWMVKGWSTPKGSRTVTDLSLATEDSPAVARMREHGAVFLGKTTLCEFGWKGVCDSPLTGISRNPWDPAMTCGGSSGGAGIAAALGMGALHIGSDGAGSLRIPAAFCGVYGFKATFGRVPTYPTGRMQGISHVGPLVRTVADAALLLTVISGSDDRDWQALPPEPLDYQLGLDDGIAGLRLAYSRTLGYAHPDPDVVACVDAAVAVLRDLGADVTECDPGFAEPRQSFEVMWGASMAGVLASIPEALHVLIDPGYVAAAEAGRRYTAEDLMVAGIERAALARHMNAFYRRFDLLVTPALAVASVPAGMDYPPDRGMTSWFDWNPFLYPFNYTQAPAASLPCGFTPGGMPVGMQVTGPRFSEAAVLRASRSYESRRPFRMPP
jgi:aspartyl-tRNA(Asn)/glutamyl-tRNA(Gln) amidotransferase subunit A